MIFFNFTDISHKNAQLRRLASFTGEYQTCLEIQALLLTLRP